MKIKSVLSMVMALTMSASIALFAGCNFGRNNNESSGDETKATSYVNLEINPDVELTVDAENKVVSVHGGNRSGSSKDCSKL